MVALTKSQRVLQAIKELQNAGKRAHRQTLADAMGEPLGIIDDHIKVLIENGEIKRAELGVVETIKAWRKDQPISVTHLEEGEVLVEKGDVKIDFTPSEWRKLGNLAMGSSLAFSLGVKG
jgi:hypothetical protein